MNFWLSFTTALRLTIRSRIIPLALFILAAMALAVFMAAQFSGRQPATVALDVGLSVLRLGFPLLIVLQVQELVSREFERRFYLTSMTYPMDRRYWLLGRFAALGVLVLALLGVVALALSALVYGISQGYPQVTEVGLGLPFWITMGFLSVDLLVLMAVAFFLAVVASTPSFVLIGTLGFMLIARSFATIIALLQRDGTLVEHTESYSEGLGTLGYLLPDLGALDVRMITLYNKLELLSEHWPILLTTNAIYTTALLAMAVWAIQRKRFA